MARSRLLAGVILTSEKLNNINEGSENLFYHILVLVDDFGRYYSKPEIIKSYCYPLRSIPLSTIRKRLDNLESIGLIRRYKNNGETYLEIVEFEKYQKFRSDIKRKEDFPTPIEYCNESDTSRNESDTTCNTKKSLVNRNRSDNKGENENIERVVKYLNEKTGKKFSVRSSETIRLINGLLNDGYKIDQFIEVIDKKVLKWGSDVKMCDYLRPTTLFRKSNFENYLNEKSPEVEKSSTQLMIEKLKREKKED